MIFNLYKLDNQLTVKEQELKKLNKNHEALAKLFDEKVINIEKLENLILGTNQILIAFIANPSDEEKNCMHQIIKYLNNNFKE